MKICKYFPLTHISTMGRPVLRTDALFLKLEFRAASSRALARCVAGRDKLRGRRVKAIIWASASASPAARTVLASGAAAAGTILSLGAATTSGRRRRETSLPAPKFRADAPHVALPATDVAFYLWVITLLI